MLDNKDMLDSKDMLEQLEAAMVMRQADDAVLLSHDAALLQAHDDAHEDEDAVLQPHDNAVLQAELALDQAAALVETGDPVPQSDMPQVAVEGVDAAQVEGVEEAAEEGAEDDDAQAGEGGIKSAAMEEEAGVDAHAETEQEDTQEERDQDVQIQVVLDMDIEEIEGERRAVFEEQLCAELCYAYSVNANTEKMKVVRVQAGSVVVWIVLQPGAICYM
jgi:hypothetical protein